LSNQDWVGRQVNYRTDQIRINAPGRFCINPKEQPGARWSGVRCGRAHQVPCLARQTL